MGVIPSGGGTLTVRVPGVPFPIEFADWTKGNLVEQVEKIIRKFASELMAVVRTEVVSGVDAMFETRVPSNVPVLQTLPQIQAARHSSNGRVKPKVAVAKPTVLSKLKKTNGAPIQLCPAPGCKSPAAPVFSMLCAKHKDAKKTDVAKWREARRKKNAATPKKAS